MTAANRIFGASVQESFYVVVLRRLADAIEAGVLDLKAVTTDDDLGKGELAISLVFSETVLPPVEREP